LLPLQQVFIMDKALYLKEIDLALDDIRPHLAVDGGNIEVVDISDDKIVYVKWQGNCDGCSMTAMTMRAGVEYTIKSKMPEIHSVVALN
jgi:Fe-S cluster biogenesis protein NfuA